MFHVILSEIILCYGNSIYNYIGMKDRVKSNIGLLVCVNSLFVYFLLQLPLILSIECANENQGFAFTFGQSLLMWHKLPPGRGLLFVLPYAVILKIFGYNTYSILALHILETIVLILIGVLIYLIVNKVLHNNLWSGLAVLLWVVMIISPIGFSELKVEIRSHYNLQEECLSVLFSLFSVLFLLKAGFFDQKKIHNTSEKMFSILAGIFAVSSIMSKANGAILLIAAILWFIQIFIFQREIFDFLKSRIFYYFIGVISSIFLLNLILYTLNGNLITLWRDYFFIGSYTRDYLSSPKEFSLSIINFMTRHTKSISNFVLFSSATLLFIWGIIRGCLTTKNKTLSMFLSFLGIWGVGNACVIIAPGQYQPYYYHLMWPLLAIVFSVGLSKLFNCLNTAKRNKLAITLSIIFSVFFIHRVITSIPAHIEIIKKLIPLNIFNQSQSFQDPVLPYDIQSSQRPGYFQITDSINNLLPNKRNTLYILNLYSAGQSALTPLTYIYAKRYPPTSVDCGLLQVPGILQIKTDILKQELSKNLPDVLIVAEKNYIWTWQARILNPFMIWFSDFVKNNYKFYTTLNYVHLNDNNRQEHFFVYKKN